MQLFETILDAKDLQTFQEIFLCEQTNVARVSVGWDGFSDRGSFVRESWKQSKTRDHDRACIYRKNPERSVASFVYVGSILWESRFLEIHATVLVTVLPLIESLARASICMKWSF